MKRDLAAARSARREATRPGELAVQSRLKIPGYLEPQWKAQDNRERGQSWADGIAVQQESAMLLQAIAELAGAAMPSYIVDAEGVTITMGDNFSVTKGSLVEATIALLRAVMESRHESESQE